MKDKKFYFSIIMATYNSENTIDKALASIRKQNFAQEEIEVVVVDGGSTDSTREIAHKYNAVVLNNPYKLPEPAKMIGLKYASGKYLSIMDSDEEIADETFFMKRKLVLEKHKELRCLAIGLSTPKNSDPCCYYINSVGDPFSCFVYKTYKDSMEGLIKKKGTFDKKLKCYVAKYSEDEIRPIGDSGTVMDLEFIMSHYQDKLDKVTTATLFDYIIQDTGYVGYVENDNHMHYTEASFSVFFKKLKFRIINNIFDVDGSGYANKAKTNRRLSSRKYLFPIYTILILFPLIDGVRMSINYKHWVFLLHPFFCIYVLFEIVVQYFCKILGFKKKNTGYAK